MTWYEPISGKILHIYGIMFSVQFYWILNRQPCQSALKTIWPTTGYCSLVFGDISWRRDDIDDAQMAPNKEEEIYFNS